VSVDEALAKLTVNKLHQWHEISSTDYI